MNFITSTLADTDSLEIKTEDVYKDSYQVKNMFNFSDYPYNKIKHKGFVDASFNK